MNTLTLNQQPVSSGFRVDVSRGERIGRVSSEWFSRPDDERYLNLTELYDTVRRRTERAHDHAEEKGPDLSLSRPRCHEDTLGLRRPAGTVIVADRRSRHRILLVAGR